jgi:hypothetical protein
MKLNPSVNYRKEWMDMKNVAGMIKYWSTGENRPINGSYFGFINQRKKSKFVMPKFYN